MKLCVTIGNLYNGGVTVHPLKVSCCFVGHSPDAFMTSQPGTSFKWRAEIDDYKAQSPITQTMGFLLCSTNQMGGKLYSFYCILNTLNFVEAECFYA